MNTQTVRRDKATIERQTMATAAFINKMHRLWHEVRNLDVCLSLACKHPWAPR